MLAPRPIESSAIRWVHTRTLLRMQRLPIGRHLPNQILQLIDAHADEPQRLRKIARAKVLQQDRKRILD